jgi:DNA-binding Lrp family transcriptional regulator
MDILQKDASISNVRLADKVGLAPSSCLRRVAALKKKGVIRRIVALPDAEKVGRGLKVIVTVKRKEHDDASLQSVIQRFDESNAVSQVYTVSGETDLIVVMSAPTMSAFQSTIREILSEVGIIEQYFSHFILEEHKFEPSL